MVRSDCTLQFVPFNCSLGDPKWSAWALKHQHQSSIICSVQKSIFIKKLYICPFIKNNTLLKALLGDSGCIDIATKEVIANRPPFMD